MMELLEFKNRIFSLFGVNDINEFSDALMKCVSEYDESMMSGYEEIVGSDFSEDWMQKLFQYYAADRKGAKQDFTPKSLARLVSALADEGEIVDQCAGTGSLTIQRWLEDRRGPFTLEENDEKVIPFLLFNLAVRNMDATVFEKDVLADEIRKVYVVKPGERYAKVVAI